MYLFKKNIEMLNFLSCFFLVGVIVIATSCETSDTNQNKEEQTDIQGVAIATVTNGKITTSVSKTTLKDLAVKAYNDASREEIIKSSTFDKVFTQGGGNNYYIIGKGTDNDGNCISIATPLAVFSEVRSSNKESSPDMKTLSAGPENPGEYTHKCTGDPCSNCDFTYKTDKKEEIDGCRCRSLEGGEGQCNHTVIS